MKAFLSIVMLLGLFIATPAIAKTPVEVISTGADNVGQRLVYAVKEEIRASSTFEITFDQKKPRLVLYITTMDPSNDKNGINAIYSLVIVISVDDSMPPYYINSAVGRLSSGTIRDAADTILATASENIDFISKALSQ